MTDLKPTQTDWDIRRHVYEVFVSQGRAPSHQAIAACFDIAAEAASQALRRLDIKPALGIIQAVVQRPHGAGLSRANACKRPSHFPRA